MPTSRREFIGSVTSLAGLVVGASMFSRQPMADASTTQAKPFSPAAKDFASVSTQKQTVSTDINSVKKNTHPLPQKELTVNVSDILPRNTINVTVASLDESNNTKTIISLDRKNFKKIGRREIKHENLRLPIFRPSPQVIKDIPNTELLTAAIIAGAVTESIRTTVLYPLSTVKNRIQVKRKFRIKRGFKSLIASFRRQFRQGNLYAGIAPSLLITVPTSGVYCGVRDVTKRMLNMALQTPSKYDDLAISLTGALVADIVSIAVRTPVDSLAVRLQVKRDDETDEDAARNWLSDSLRRIPVVILTDLPYLLSRITLSQFVTSGDEDLRRYELITIAVACLCAALTTPFDVARTRILVDSDFDASNGLDGGSGEGVLQTMVKTTREGGGGLLNLYAGWAERTAYLVGRAWLDPIRVIGYLGVRDALLLEWFD